MNVIAESGFVITDSADGGMRSRWQWNPRSPSLGIFDHVRSGNCGHFAPEYASGKWSYLATWQDKFSKRILGWAVEERMTDELVTKAFAKAVASGGIGAKTIVHTDRGSQYVSHNFRRILQANQCRQSMSRRGNCWDNAQAESLFSRYKAELLEGGVFEDASQARGETFSYIEGYYNRVRRHSALGYKSPEEFEREWKIKTREANSERVVSSKT